LSVAASDTGNIVVVISNVLRVGDFFAGGAQHQCWADVNLATFLRGSNTSLKIRISNLLTNVSDTDGPSAISLVSYSTPTVTNGVNLNVPTPLTSTTPTLRMWTHVHLYRHRRLQHQLGHGAGSHEDGHQRDAYIVSIETNNVTNIVVTLQVFPATVYLVQARPT